MTDSRLPEDYKEESSQKDNYFKAKDGDNKIRILTSPTMGYEYFNHDNKPVRSRTLFTTTPDIKDGGKVKQFRAVLIWNYDEKRLQVMSITQASIKTQLTGFSKDEDYGSPLGYDIKLNKTGESLETKYQVKPLSKSEVSAEIQKAHFDALSGFDMNRLFDNGHPLS